MNIKYKKDDQIIEELSFIQSTDFKRNAGIYGIKNALSDSIYGYGNDPFSLNMEEFFLYRVRKNYDENGPVEFFDHTDEIWAPPDIEKIKKGRCNEEYERMLYCSNHPLTCLAEMHFEVGDYFTTIVYKGDEQKKLEKVNFVRIPELIQNDNLLTELLSNYMKNLDQSLLGKKRQLIDKLVAIEFQKKVEKTALHEYNFTIAWTQLCFSLEGNNCLVYPSVLSKLGTSNWAILPDYARTVLFPIEVRRSRVDRVSPDGVYLDITTDHIAAVSSHGSILWRRVSDIVEHITHKRVSNNPYKMKN